jgi:hypothetical protein
MMLHPRAETVHNCDDRERNAGGDAHSRETAQPVCDGAAAR